MQFFFSFTGFFNVGGASHNGKRGRCTDKAKIVVAVFKAENGVPLFARMKAVENVQGKTLQEIIDQYVAPQTKVECDGCRSYLNLEGGCFIHNQGFLPHDSSIESQTPGPPSTVFHDLLGIPALCDLLRLPGTSWSHYLL